MSCSIISAPTSKVAHRDDVVVGPLADGIVELADHGIELRQRRCSWCRQVQAGP